MIIFLFPVLIVAFTNHLFISYPKFFWLFFLISYNYQNLRVKTELLLLVLLLSALLWE